MGLWAVARTRKRPSSRPANHRPQHSPASASLLSPTSGKTGATSYCYTATSSPGCWTRPQSQLGDPSCPCKPVRHPPSACLKSTRKTLTNPPGNTVYIGLGLAAPSESTRWIKSATSLGCFCVGSFVFSRFHRFFSPRRRWVLVASFFAQAALCAAAAALLTFGPKGGKDDVGWNVLVPIGLVAFQSCGQAVTSRALQFNALTSVVLTSIYCDLFSDAQLFAVHNVERNRRAAAPLLLLLGAVLGGLIAHSEFGVAGALWTAVALKLVAMVAWAMWPADNSEE
jgi:hypothetical protein